MPCGEITKKGRAILDHAALSLAFGPVDLRPVAKWTRGLWPCRPAPASWRVTQKNRTSSIIIIINIIITIIIIIIIIMIIIS